MKSNWQKIKLGDACTLTKGLTYKSGDYASIDDGLVFLTLKSIAKGGGFNFDGVKYYKGGTHDDQFVTPNDLIIANTDLTRAGDVIGAPLFVPQIDKGNKYVYSMDITKIVTDESKLSRNYLYHYLLTNNVRNYMRGISNGSTVLHLKVNLVNKLDIPLPPLEIQAKIVEILSGIDAEIRYTNQIVQKTEELKKGLMQSILSFGNKENIRYLALGEIGKVSMCKRIFKNETSATGDIPFYKIGTFGKDPDSFISQELYDSYRNKYPFPKIGDVLLSASGTIGRKVKYDGRPAYFQDSNIVWLEHDESKILNDFLFYLYDTITWQTEGSTIKRLYNDILLKKVIPVPSIKKQRQILKVLSAVDEKISVNKKLKERFTLLKNGLMQDIFSQKVNIL
ncbi:MAG: restriction endonuclease subunit S [bacterium]|nr:restriction endonuclease subunit S [bacterium]